MSNPDGTRLASGSEDKTVRLWDASSGEELAVLRGHQQVVRLLAFGPDGSRLASWSQDTTVRLWDTISNADRYQERRAILAAGTGAKRMVDKLWQKLNDWEAVARRLCEDTSLTDPLRRAARDNILRRAIAHP